MLGGHKRVPLKGCCLNSITIELNIHKIKRNVKTVVVYFFFNEIKHRQWQENNNVGWNKNNAKIKNYCVNISGSQAAPTNGGVEFPFVN